jgi:hypothetical protein
MPYFIDQNAYLGHNLGSKRGGSSRPASLSKNATGGRIMSKFELPSIGALVQPRTYTDMGARP